MRFHYCPQHGWERCYFSFDYGHGCTESMEVWEGGRAKELEMY